VKDIWHKLEMRLRSIAQGNWQQSRQADETSQCCLIKISLFYSDELIGWLRPEIMPLEPRGMNPMSVCQRVSGWRQVIEDLKTQKERTLVVQRGEPVGWLKKPFL